MRLYVGTFCFFHFLSFCRGCIELGKRDLFLGTHAKYNISAAYLESEQLIRQKGYPSEKHFILTDDGYILGLHRIPYGVRNDPSKRKGPVLIVHDLLGEAMNWVLLPPEKSLAFRLADEGYDVWLGNFRGNTHSKGHLFFSPCDNAFWDYTWHESGVHDLPAMIDFILEKTKATKLEFMGHSMGTTAFFVMLSEKPEYNEKISKGHLMAPIAYVKHMRSPLVRAFSHIGNIVEVTSKIFTAGSFFPESDLFRLIKNIACDISEAERKLCTQILFLIGGIDPEQFDKDLMGTLMYHYPGAFSGKTLNHYAQLYVSGEFRQYDYGIEKNFEHYGVPIPPSYNLKNVRVPTVIYSSLNDYLSAFRDAEKLISLLPSLEKFYVIKHPKFSHFDYIYAKDADTLVYDEVIKRLSKV